MKTHKNSFAFAHHAQWARNEILKIPFSEGYAASLSKNPRTFPALQRVTNEHQAYRMVKKGLARNLGTALEILAAYETK
ncbi:hypothetical protein CEXT_92571 [Caerostris extrusa]|uniref:Uncharacterized protein n=1 Tax=Caerostris extrusa TaxID=172846 RepID=A0AAV4NTI7_CAEEX|nr:hypothetical protein CEXT_92571 [Caerostris extrusa]